MPKTSVKQKTRQKFKPTSRSPFENARATQEDSDEMNSNMSDDTDDIPEKDEAEKKLERLLFGDDEGFQGALKSQKERSLIALSKESDDEGSDAEHEETGNEDQELDGVADADVRIHLPPTISLSLASFLSTKREKKRKTVKLLVSLM